MPERCTAARNARDTALSCRCPRTRFPSDTQSSRWEDKLPPKVLAGSRGAHPGRLDVSGGGWRATMQRIPEVTARQGLNSLQPPCNESLLLLLQYTYDHARAPLRQAQ